MKCMAAAEIPVQPIKMISLNCIITVAHRLAWMDGRCNTIPQLVPQRGSGLIYRVPFRQTDISLYKRVLAPEEQQIYLRQMYLVQLQ